MKDPWLLYPPESFEAEADHRDAERSVSDACTSAGRYIVGDGQRAPRSGWVVDLRCRRGVRTRAQVPREAYLDRRNSPCSSCSTRHEMYGVGLHALYPLAPGNTLSEWAGRRSSSARAFFRSKAAQFCLVSVVFARLSKLRSRNTSEDVVRRLFLVL